MNILWMTWKDLSHPLAGGAETVNEELAARLAVDGHAVRFIVGAYPNAVTSEERNGFEIIRLGGRFSVYWKAYRYYKQHLRGWADLVIDEVNTIPFFARWYVKERNIIFIHQLAREIWFYQMPFPLSVIGYLAEPIYLRALRKSDVITVSQSSKADLVRYGFDPARIHVISEGIRMQPLPDLEHIEKYPQPTVLALGSVRAMKRTLHVLEAFERAKAVLPDLRLIIAGDDNNAYGLKLRARAAASKYADAIRILGKVNTDTRAELMQKSHLLAVTSVREGWGLVVTEAASQGTPAVVYDVPGLRDSVRHNETGVVCERNRPDVLAGNIVSLLQDRTRYERLRQNAWKWSKEVTFERSYEDFCIAIKKAVNSYCS